jgi:molecular chaperone GrpE
MDDKQEKLEELKKKHERKIRRQENKEEKDKKDDMIKSLSENVQELQNKLLYQQAEFANYKKRREEETRNMLKYQNFDMASEIINIMDSLERALSVPADKLTEEVKKYLEGFRIMYNNLVNILNKFEIHEIDCLNKEFDHNTCQALMTEHIDGVKPGVVIQVLQKGYILKDKLLRPALVKVSE